MPHAKMPFGEVVQDGSALDELLVRRFFEEFRLSWTFDAYNGEKRGITNSGFQGV
jgi:hypothetical protein